MPTMGFVITRLEEAGAYCMTKDGWLALMETLVWTWGSFFIIA